MVEDLNVSKKSFWFFGSIPHFCLVIHSFVSAFWFCQSASCLYPIKQFITVTVNLWEHLNSFQKKLPFWRITSEAFDLWLMFHRLNIHETCRHSPFAFLNENYNNIMSFFFHSPCRLVLSFTKAHSICSSLGAERDTYIANLIPSNFVSSIIAYSVLTSGRGRSATMILLSVLYFFLIGLEYLLLVHWLVTSGGQLSDCKVFVMVKVIAFVSYYNVPDYVTYCIRRWAYFLMSM